jgi:hypothetical protein
MQDAERDRSGSQGDRTQESKSAGPGKQGGAHGQTGQQPPARTLPNRELTAAAAAVIGGCLLMAAFLIDHNAPPMDASAAGIAVPRQTAPVVVAPTHPKWTSGSHSRWRTANPRNAVFELAAQNKVPVWMKHVRPMLVVRCLSKNTEAFVFIESAAAIESQDEDHTVQVAFDNEPASVERWPDSVEHDALFAPAGDAFVRRMARARTMRFAFTPHNALPTEAQFEVSGFSELIEPVAKQCGWQ